MLVDRPVEAHLVATDQNIMVLLIKILWFTYQNIMVELIKIFWFDKPPCSTRAASTSCPCWSKTQ